MRTIGLVILALLFVCLCIPCALADEDIVKQASNLSLVAPTPGTALLGSKDSMTDYQGSLVSSSDQLMSFFSKIMALFGLSGMDYSQSMDSTLQGGLQSAKGSVNSATSTPTLVQGFGSVSIRTMPGGAQVFFNGEFRGQTPDDPNKPLMISNIETGSYQVDLRKSGYTFETENVVVKDKSFCYLYRELNRAS